MKRVLLAVFLIAISAVAVGYLHGADTDPDQLTKPSEEIKVSVPFGKTYNYSDLLVTKVIDGDTLMLETGESLRLIGIDTFKMQESKKLYHDSRNSKQNVDYIQELWGKPINLLKI